MRANLLATINGKIGATTISQYAYTNDNGGRRTNVAYTGTSFSATHSDQWSYNSRNELTESRRFDNLGSPVHVLDHVYEYDNIGNRTSYVPGTRDPVTENIGYSRADSRQFSRRVF
jgi:hypothetical protein